MARASDQNARSRQRIFFVGLAHRVGHRCQVLGSNSSQDQTPET
jgi:hypothetical protein